MNVNGLEVANNGAIFKDFSYHLVQKSVLLISIFKTMAGNETSKLKISEIKLALKRSIEANKKANIDSKTDEECFIEEFENVNLQGEEKNLAKLEILPRFYTALPAENDELKQKLREEARAQFLQVCEFCRIIIYSCVSPCRAAS